MIDTRMFEMPTVRNARIVKDTFQEYKAVDALNNSGITNILQCPALYSFYKKNPSHDTDATRFGSLLHCMVLEPETFNGIYGVTTKAGNTKAGMAELAAIAESGRMAVKIKDVDSANAMAEALHSAPELSFLSDASALKEQSIYWSETIADTAVNFKARLDFIGEPLLLADVKTISDSSPEKIVKSVYDFGYYRQAYFYMRAYAAISGQIPPAPVFAFVAKAPPHLVTAVTFNALTLAAGYKEFKRGVNLYVRCLTEKCWPNFTKNKIISMGLPAWAYQKIEGGQENVNV